MRKRTIVNGFLLLLLAGTSYANPLVGTWKTPFIGDQQGFQLRGERVLTETTMTIVFRYSSKIFNGDVGAGEVVIVMDYEIEGPHPSLPNTWLIKQTLVSVTDTALTQFIVDSHNDDKFCGFDDWEIGVPKDITGIVCTEGDDPFNAGEEMYDIIQIRGGHQLLTGLVPDEDEEVGRTPETRPTELDESMVYEKQ